MGARVSRRPGGRHSLRCPSLPAHAIRALFAPRPAAPAVEACPVNAEAARIDAIIDRLLPGWRG